MPFTIKLMVLGVALSIALAAGYWWGNTQSRAITGAALSEAAKPQKRILYYRNPMGLPDTSPVPKKDAMGMDYLPVYADEELPSDTAFVTISAEKIQKLGVRTEAVALRELGRIVRAVATIQPDERKRYTVTTKFEGWIQRLTVNATGQAIKKGDVLMDIYSPELITAQHEYLIAQNGIHGVAGSGFEAQAGMQRLAESALQKLRNWDIAETEIQRLQREGKIRQSMPLRSKANGVVLEKPSIEGRRFLPGEVLYQIADLSSVWILADVFEQDIGRVHPDQAVTIKIDAYPDKTLSGKVDFVYPTITPETRTAIVRIKLPNSDGLLKPDMYARVEFASFHSKDRVLAIPDSAILDTGIRQIALVDLSAGRFEPRAVKLGMRADGYVEVLEGLQAGEKVVIKANFLIDAESNFKNALNSFGETPPNSIINAQKAESRSPAAKISHIKHRGEGTIKAIDFTQNKITLAHDPIASLQWPAMTMDFSFLETTLLQSLRPGQKVVFEIIEESAGEFVIVHIEPANASPAASNHGGH
jgi:Cu(I)/Ag(I) efflux system membrane fusion protein